MSNLFSHKKVGCSLLCALFFSVSLFAQTGDLQNDLRNSFKKFNLVQLDNQAALRNVESRQSLTIPADDKIFELNLTPRDLRTARYRAEETTADGVRALEKGAVTTFKGTIAGETNSQVRLTIDEKKIEGYFLNDKGERFFIEPARNYSRLAGEKDLIVYQEKDLLKTADFVCESELGEKIERGKEMISVNRFNVLPTLRVLEIATEADFSFVTELGGAGNANNEILGILNLIEGNYETELGLTFDVVFQHAWSTADPFDGSTSSLFLNSFRTYWNANFPQSSVPRDAAHLFTSRPNFNGRGLSYVGTVCKTPTSAYGFTGRLDVGTIKYVLTAHEIGHSFGANHADGIQGCDNTIMIATVNNLTPVDFCQFSRTEITNFVAANNSCLSPRVSGSTLYDFDGDSKSDVSVFRPSNGTWYLNRSSEGFTGTAFGLGTDKLVPADYDGDGKTDVAVYRGGMWYLQRSQFGFTGIAFGDGNDIPAPADYDGDGKADIAVFRPSNGNWFILNLTNNQISGMPFGQAGDKPVPADYDGDGRADVAVYRNGMWYLQRSTQGFIGVQFGDGNDKTVPADYDGDGKADIAVFRPSNGLWYLQQSTLGFTGTAFGAGTDVPAAADFDGDGNADISVFRPSNGTWYLNRSTQGFTGVPFGASGDVPVQSAFVR